MKIYKMFAKQLSNIYKYNTCYEITQVEGEDVYSNYATSYN